MAPAKISLMIDFPKSKINGTGCKKKATLVPEQAMEAERSPAVRAAAISAAGVDNCSF